MSQNLSFIDSITSYIETGNVVLPVFSSAGLRILKEISKKEPKIKVIENIITADQSLSSQVLKTSNSAFYQGLVEIRTIRAAIIRLGMKEVARIALLSAARSQFRSKHKILNLIMKQLWQHSVGCAIAAQGLAKICKFNDLTGHAFFAALFHDIGKLIILVVIDQMNQKSNAIPINKSLLMEAMTSLHTQQGYSLMKQWNMPEEYCVITRDHHLTPCDDRNHLLMLVRLGNLACHKLGIGIYQEETLILSTAEEAHHLNISEIDLAKIEILLEDTKILAA
jgi:HD-like signal output (HDOD) protein